MSDNFVKVKTTPEVAAVLRASHKLEVFASFSDPTGTWQGGPGEVGRMETGYGLKGTDYPLLWIRTMWAIREDGKREGEMHDYWLCIAKEQQ